MRNLKLLLIVGLVLGLPLAAQTSYILTVSPNNAQGVIDRHGLTVTKELFDGVNCVMLVTSASANIPGVETEVESDLLVGSFEPEQLTSLPELNGLTQPTLTQSSTSILDGLPGRTLVTFFGSTVPSNYTNQTATSIIRLADARTASKLTGNGVVAIIDTGADPNHPALVGVLVPGYDFTRDTPGFSELADLDPAVAAQLQQSSTSILDAQNTLQLNSSAMAILNQSSTSILDQSSTSILDSTLAEFGHGTMVAGSSSDRADGENHAAQGLPRGWVFKSLGYYPGHLLRSRPRRQRDQHELQHFAAFSGAAGRGRMSCFSPASSNLSPPCKAEICRFASSCSHCSNAASASLAASLNCPAEDF